MVADLTAMALERAALLEAEATPRPARAAPEARGGGRVRIARARRGAPARGGPRRERDRRQQGAPHPARLARPRAARWSPAWTSRSAAMEAQLSLEGGAVAEVARSRKAVLLRSDDAEGADGRLMRAAGIGCFMHAPLELGPRLYGVLSVAHEDPERFWQDDLELLVQMARSSAAAIANAIDFERERRIARALTLGFVPESLPGAAGLRDRAALLARRGRAHRRRPLRRLAAAGRRGGPADRRRGRQGRGDRGAERDGALLRGGAQLGRELAGRGAHPDQLDAAAGGCRATAS